LTTGSKTCSLPLFHSEFSNFNLGEFIFPTHISDISQKRPIRLLTLNILPFKITKIALSTVSGSMGIGLFVMKPDTQRLESTFASFRRVACLFTIYSSGICIFICTNRRRTGRSHICRRTMKLQMSLMFGRALSPYGRERNHGDDV
jgi:hypothetical protein